jgi:DNA-binding LacI/PurR family transcriptional regulator
MREVVDYLVSLGHCRIAALAWPEESRVGNNRMDGYLEGLQRAGIQPLLEWIERGHGEFDFGFQAACKLLDLPASYRPTAIVSLNDSMAVGAMHAVQSRGLKVGEDVSITGFDDSPMVRYLTPPLTSVRQPIWEAGQRITEILAQVMHGQQEGSQQVLLDPRLIVRSSTGSPTTKCL